MMSRKNVIGGIVAAVVVVAGLVLFFSRASLKEKFGRAAPPTAGVAPAVQSQTPAAQTVSPGSQDESQDDSDEEEAPIVEIPVEKQRLIGVRTATASVQPFQRVIRTVGLIGYDEKKLATVNTKFEGWIEKLFVNYTGQYVGRGQPLAEIYSPELLATQRELLDVVKWKKRDSGFTDEKIGKMLSGDTDAIVAAAEQRLRLWDISDAQIKKIEETGRPIRTLTVYSPAKGYVVQKAALQGMKVAPGEKLFDIADLSTVWVIADIYEYDIPLIKDGQSATIGLSYFPGREFTSRIDYVYPAISGDTRTAKVRFTIPNPGGLLKPQMYTDVLIKIDLGRKLVVPRDAVLDTGTRQVVYVDKGEGYFEPKEVLVGDRTDDMVEVLRGLKAGDKVASAANFLIDSEAKLQGVKPLPLPHPVKREK
jgi:Cu(I)/Ag(I) efflux system membrane fusion protein